MKDRLIVLCAGVIFLFFFSKRFFTLQEAVSYSMVKSLVFEPFTWFMALLLLIISFLCFSKILFYFLLPQAFKYEKTLYTICFVGILLVYKQAAAIVLIFAALYAIMDAYEYSKRVRKYKRRGNN